MTHREQEAPGELERLLGPRGSAAEHGPMFDELFADVSKRCAKDDQSLLGRIRARSTPVRRLMAFVSFGIVLGLTSLPGNRPDLADYPLVSLAILLGSLGTLLAVAMIAALRPTHLPALPTWQTAALTTLTIVATALLALAPGLHPDIGRDVVDVPLFHHSAPCFVYGLAVGLPVYAALRVLDRGNPLGRLLAASAAGLTGNMILELHCSVNGGVPHLLTGHVMVLVTFVAAVGLAEWVAQRR